MKTLRDLIELREKHVLATGASFPFVVTALPEFLDELEDLSGSYDFLRGQVLGMDLISISKKHQG